MEVEAKFSLLDQGSFQRLQVTTRLAGFPLAKGQVRVVHDTYMDTPERKILAGGYACRFRQEAEGIRITIKGLGGALGAIHKREEMELVLPAIQPIEEWPAGPLRKKVLKLVHGEALVPLLEMHQTRIVRPVRQLGQVIAELSLDDVRVTAGKSEQTYCELEVELTPLGNEDQLNSIAKVLQEKWQLRPELSSKFERALILLDTQSEQVAAGTQVVEMLTRIAERDDWNGLRSRALLALNKGLSKDEVARQVVRSKRTIRRWAAAFMKSGLGIFPNAVIEGGTPPVFQNQAEISVDELPAVPASPPPPAIPKIILPEKPGLQADDSMAEVTRKTLYFQFQHMLFHEPGTQLGQEAEELHDMRVATRRMRAALQVFGDYLDKKKWAPFEKDLRRTGRVLGKVRDLDVFWEKTQRYQDTLPVERKDELAPLQIVWQAERDQAREEMLAYLTSQRYRKFKDSFSDFLDTHEAGAAPVIGKAGEPQPSRLRHVAPVILYRQWSAMRAFEEGTIGPDVPLVRLHQLRIASKGLRYSLEFLEEVLGAESKLLVKELKRLQDHLGDLQDAVVASNMLRDFLAWGSWGHDYSKKSPPMPIAPVVAPGVALYLAARQADLQQLPASFPEVWARIQSQEFKHNFISALEVL